MNEESHNPSIEPELEARIVALVLGEASDFETEELNRLIAQRPDLAAFKLQMQKVHGLLQDVSAGEFEAPDDTWKLPTDRRSSVLAVIRGEVSVQPASLIHDQVQKLNSVPSPCLGEKVADRQDEGLVAAGLNRSTRRWQWNLTKVAAVVCVAGFIGVMALQSFYSDERSASEYFYAAAKTAEPRGGIDLMGGTNLSSQLKPESAAASSVLLSRSPILKYNAEPMAEQTLAQSASGNVDYKKSSEHALSALQDTLGRNGTLPSPDYLTDDIQYLPAGPEFKLRDAVAQHGASTLEKEGRSTATFDVGAVSSPPAADLSVVIADNSTAVTSGELGYDARDGLADSKPEAPDKGEVAFPNSVDSWGGVSDSGPAGTETSTPRIIIENKEEEVIGETSLEFAMSDLPSQLPDLQQKQGQQQSLNRNEPGADFAKDRVGLGAAGNGVDGEQLGNEGKPIDGLSFAGTADDSPMADKNLNGLLGEADDGLGTYAQDNSGFGRGRFRGDIGAINGGRLGVPSGNWNIEMPADAKGDATQIPEGFANFDSTGLEEPSRAEVSGRGSVARAKSAEDSAGTPSPESLQEAIRQPGDEKSGGEGFVDGRPDGDVTPDNGRGVDFDFNFEDPIEISTETPAFRSRQLTIPGPKTGGVAGIQDNREPESTRSPGAEKPAASTATAQPEQYPIIDGFNSPGKNVLPLWSKRNEQPGASRQRSGELARERVGSRNSYRSFAPALKDRFDLMKRPSVKAVAPSAGLNEKTAAEEAFSTFSLHVSDVSFKLAAAALARGEWPEAAKIRIEEFVNAFDYGDPMPRKGEKIACVVEQSIHPFVQQRNILRVSMRTAAEGRASSTPLRLTFLLDNSGSMERADRQDTVRRAFTLLSQQLSPIDQVTLISFARQPRLLAEKVSGAESGQLVKMIDELPSEGGTNIEAALQLAFEKATHEQTAGAQNRIILLTDGAVNLGDADPESLSRMVTMMRDAGIAFDAAGISAEGLNDEVLEALTRKGDGRYYLLDSLEDAHESFVRQVAGALRPSAGNVKVQIEFNPKRVGHYKLLGFEKHILKQEDFHNDAVDAAEMAAAEAGVAVYQFEAKPDGEGDVGSVSVRFRDLSTGQMVENRWPIPYEADAPRPDQAAPSLRIATSAALLAAKLRGEPLGEAVDLKTLSDLISGLPVQDQNNTRVQQLKLMIEQARQMSEK